MCPAVGAGKIRVGPSRTPAPTEAYLVMRRGGALPLPRATARVAPTEGLQEVRCGEESPSHGFAATVPFIGKGAEGTGVRIATGALRPRNDMVFCKESVQGRRADRVVRPYGIILALFT